MSEAVRTYWSVMAQLLPVLGLALVLEARAVANAVERLKRSTSNGISANQGAIRWTLAFMAIGAVGIFLALSIAMGALETNEAPGRVASTAASLAFSSAVAATLVTPIILAWVTLEFDNLLRLTFLSPKRYIQVRAIMRDLRRTKRRLTKARSNSLALWSEGAELKRHHEEELSRHRAEGDAATYEACVAQRDTISERLTELWEQCRWLIRMDHNIRLFELELKQYLRRISTEHRESWLTDMRIRRAGIPHEATAYAIVTTSASAENFAPDDGGFLSPLSASEVLHPPSDTDPWIHRSEDWYVLRDPLPVPESPKTR